MQKPNSEKLEPKGFNDPIGENSPKLRVRKKEMVTLSSKIESRKAPVTVAFGRGMSQHASVTRQSIHSMNSAQ